MRTALVISDGVPIETIVLPEGNQGDAMLSETCVEITGINPKPAVGVGWVYADGAFIPPAAFASTWDDIRAERNRLLQDSDWTQVSDAPLTEGEVKEWALYRQALRDLPQDYGSPEDVVWPNVP